MLAVPAQFPFKTGFLFLCASVPLFSPLCQLSAISYQLSVPSRVSFAHLRLSSFVPSLSAFVPCQLSVIGYQFSVPSQVSFVPGRKVSFLALTRNPVLCAFVPLCLSFRLCASYRLSVISYQILHESPLFPLCLCAFMPLCLPSVPLCLSSRLCAFPPFALRIHVFNNNVFFKQPLKIFLDKREKS